MAGEEAEEEEETAVVVRDAVVEPVNIQDEYTWMEFGLWLLQLVSIQLTNKLISFNEWQIFQVPLGRF